MTTSRWLYLPLLILISAPLHATQQLEVQPGWQLLAIHAAAADEHVTVADQFSVAGVERLFAYIDGSWAFFDATLGRGALGSEPLTKLRNRGIWVLGSDTADVTIRLDGTSQEVGVAALQLGWNLIGTGPTTIDVDDLVERLSSVAVIDRIFSYSSAGWQFRDVANSRGSLTTLEPELGYWVRISELNQVVLVAPTALTVTPADGRVTLSWPAVSGATGYQLYIATETGVTPFNYTSLSGGARYTTTDTYLTLDQLENNQRYYFVLTASNHDGESPDATAEQQAVPFTEAAFHYLNQLRQEAGMLTYLHNDQLALAAQNHAEYGVLNDITGHDEVSGYSGFTGATPQDRAQAAGYQAFNATGEVIAYSDTAATAIDDLMSAIYHRFGLLRNDGDEIGMALAQDDQEGGISSSFVAVNGNSAMNQLCQGESFSGFGTYYRLCDPEIRVAEADYLAASEAIQQQNPALVVWPPIDGGSVAPAFFEENPDPLPDRSVSGYPVSVAFNPQQIEQVTLTSLRLFDTERGDEITDVRLLDHTTDPNGKFTPHQFALFPLQRLDFNHRYRVELAYVADGVVGELTWFFNTTPLDGTIYQLSGSEQTLTVASDETLYLYMPPTESIPTISSWGINYYGTAPTISAYDGNTLQVNYSGNSGDVAILTLSPSNQIVTLKAPLATEPPTGLDGAIYTTTGSGEPITVDADERFYLFLVPTDEYPSIRGWESRYYGTSLEIESYDNHTLAITYAGDSGDSATIELADGGGTIELILR